MKLRWGVPFQSPTKRGIPSAPKEVIELKDLDEAFQSPTKRGGRSDWFWSKEANGWACGLQSPINRGGPSDNLGNYITAVVDWMFQSPTKRGGPSDKVVNHESVYGTVSIPYQAGRPFCPWRVCTGDEGWISAQIGSNVVALRRFWRAWAQSCLDPIPMAPVYDIDAGARTEDTS
jgi:hypothetical protein